MVKVYHRLQARSDLNTIKPMWVRRKGVTKSQWEPVRVGYEVVAWYNATQTNTNPITNQVFWHHPVSTSGNVLTKVKGQGHGFWPEVRGQNHSRSLPVTQGHRSRSPLTTQGQRSDSLTYGVGANIDHLWSYDNYCSPPDGISDEFTLAIINGNRERWL